MYIYIFTDGYLEYQNKENKQFYFGNDEIEASKTQFVNLVK